ncbi:staphylopine uptake ABC transporter ATP-binding protein CntD [Staphylococcus felis]|uniref:staphylopine uptake ABC transporter ATP-binding protein CntD n=1 Tax=Staphylococcus felis TaxID=46127 RepID=UPI000E25057D|nr:ABC transporter ATP-binding protein [Staphylococcus felis]REH84465.1 nickel import ATP-binding protein NikD [Staphylococcus felis]REH89019.1 nickel import ATP-binding protein NikD [Staphylococcus felis]
MKFLKIDNLTITDAWTETTLVKDVSLELEKGETLGIIGESGSGKSLTCKAIAGLNPKHLRTSGEIIFNGINMNHQSEKALRQLRGRAIAMIMQQGSRAFDPSTTVGKQMIEVMRTHTQLTQSEVKETLITYMSYMALKQPEKILHTYPHELSGGMLQRLMIVLALALKPQLIIADEPTTALDTITQYEVLEAFAKIKQQFDCSIIFISHDLTVIQNIADKVAVMKKGAIVEMGPKEVILKQPTHQYTKYLLTAKKKINDHFKQVLRGASYD